VHSVQQADSVFFEESRDAEHLNTSVDKLHIEANTNHVYFYNKLRKYEWKQNQFVELRLD